MNQLALRMARLSIAVLAVSLCCFALPALANAATVMVRIEGFNSTLVTSQAVMLPSSTVAPTGTVDPTETCGANTIVGAVDAATNHNWSGTWSATGGWSLDTIDGASASAAGGREWLPILNSVAMNTSPCQTTVANGDDLILYPACVTATTNCFSSGPLLISGPAQAGLGGFTVQVREFDVTFHLGAATAVEGNSGGATVTGPDGSATTDDRYGSGTASLVIGERGPATVVASKLGHARDLLNTCITDGSDGYCGTTIPAPVPFDPLKYCQTTGSDGYCGSPDKLAPVGHITIPGQGAKYSKGAGPTKFKGTVDFDPSQTDHVDVRLMRQIQVIVKKLEKKRKVWVRRKVHGKLVRRRVVKKTFKKIKQNACYSWNINTSDWTRLKKCDASTAKAFRADGADIWSYEFLQKLPSGAYTLDALAADGAGNVDSVMELGRNRVTFTVA